MSSAIRDELDRKIINLLQANARMPVSELAGKLGIARSTVHERIKKLEQRRIIRGYTVQLSEGLPGTEAQALVMLSVRQQNNRQLVERLATYPEIKICLAVSGQYDLFLEVATPLLEDLDSLLDEIVDIPGVERSRSVIVLAKKFDRKFT